MKILTSYEEAFAVGKEAIDSIDDTLHTPIDGGIPEYPEQINGPWKQTEEALSNTLKYVFNKLHHNCYLLCVTDGRHVMYKLESKETAPSFERVIHKTLKQKRIKTNLKTWRVMQCVLKPYKKGTFAVEWERYLQKQRNYPNGVFLFSLTDAVILRKDGREPWPLVTGDRKLEDRYTFDTFIPILAYSSQQGYWDIPIPTYDDLFTNPIQAYELDWEKKKSIAVFRGSSTGCGITPETNQRLKLATMKSGELDVGITKYTEQLKFDAKEKLGKPQKVEPVVEPIRMEAQSSYKYIIHVDGNVLAYRLLNSMLTKSLILRVKSDYIHWTDHLMKPGQHYIEIKSDLSDLQEKISWCKEHDEECEKIANAGYEFAKQALEDDYVNETLEKILWKLV